MFDSIADIAIESFNLLSQMAPYLFLGIIAAGALHVLLPVGLISRHLGKVGFGSVVKAAVLGVPLPICSCGVVPVAAALKKYGASDGATVSFLVTTPTTGVDSIMATYSLLGFAVTAARVISSLIIGIVAGAATTLGLKERTKELVVTPISHEKRSEGSKSILAVLAESIRYSFGELLGGIARPLLIGTILGGVVAYFVPHGFLEEHVGSGIWSYLVLLAIGIPLYVCASGSIPLAAALMLKGVSPGAALVFLIAGPATNIATLSVVSNMLGKRTLFIYLSVLVLGSLGAGYATDAFFAAFPSLSPEISLIGSHGEHGLGLFEILSGVALALLVLSHGIHALVARLKKPAKLEDSSIVFEVPDMSCKNCARTITGAVSCVVGVKDMSADPASKLVSVVLQGDGSPTEVEKAIVEAGFSPRLRRK